MILIKKEIIKKIKAEKVNFISYIKLFFNYFFSKELVPINEIFDILPLSGSLEPGEIENVEFVFNAISGQKFKTNAVCEVEGGPEYKVTLSGDASLISYKINLGSSGNKTFCLDFGEVRFCDWINKDFYVENNGKVTFEYHVDLSTIERKGLIEVNPLTGKISGGEKQRFIVKLSPGMPKKLEEVFFIQIGYDEPKQIHLEGKGTSATLIASLPRIENTDFVQKLEGEKMKKNEVERKLLKTYNDMLEANRISKKQDDLEAITAVLGGSNLKFVEKITGQMESV